MKDMPSVHWEDKELGLVIDASLAIIDSEVLITCESNLYTTMDDFGHVYRRAFDMARAAVDCLAYKDGLGISVVLERVIWPNGTQGNILVERPDLAKLVTAFDLNLENRENQGNNFNAMYRIMLSHPSVFLALNDLIASISASHHAPINCGRAIETIREDDSRRHK
jgi:hypothetical protein